MKLTPLGKALLFLVGLGLMLTAIYKFVPKEKLPWNRPAASKDAETASDDRSADTPSQADSPNGDAEATSAKSSSKAEWIEVTSGLFSGGAELEQTDVAKFSIQRTEVTNGQYAKFLDDCPVGDECGPRDLPSYWDDTDYVASHEDHPVVFVTWSEASAYCRWAKARLPTSVEWEKAARGTDGRSFPTGGTITPGTANLQAQDAKSRADKQIPTWATSDSKYARDISPFGVLGLAGNVSEWTATASPDEPDLRLVAGGSWDSWDLSDARAYHRLPKSPSDRSSSLGFRCAKSGS